MEMQWLFIIIFLNPYKDRWLKTGSLINKNIKHKERPIARQQRNCK
jgi:hypothetical protein